jgi:ubiquinol-cytochrome c reductase cytochrome c1 subunit
VVHGARQGEAGAGKDEGMIKPISLLLLALAVAGGVTVPAAASIGSDIRLEPAPINRLDAASLQRGAKIFVNYCLNCHSARYMRYNRLTDLGLDAAMIQDNLMFATDKIGNTMTVALSPKDAKAWFGAPPPDLTVEARVRGVDWLYNYFLGFYRDEGSVTGWNNLVFPDVGMPHVLWKLGGTNRLVVTEYPNHEAAMGGWIAAKGLAVLAPAKDHKYVVETVAVDEPGTLTLPQYMTMVADLVNYLDYMSEPARNKRINLGIIVLLYLGLLFVFAYWMKREYWKDVH